MRWVLRILAVLMLCALPAAAQQAGNAKLALVIGVGDYGRDEKVQAAGGFVTPPPLSNAVRDAGLVADALEVKGFTVTRVTNPDRRAMLTAVNAFAQAVTAAGPEAVGVLYFAGHGAQGRPAAERDVDNYLIPLGTSLTSEVDLESEALGLSRISEKLRPGPKGATILILDACRDFALPRIDKGVATRGLAEARAAPGTIIAYATAPGSKALDGAPGGNGPYAKALAEQVRAAAGTRLEDVFINVRNSVLKDTSNAQVTWENGSLRRAVTLGMAPVSLTTQAVDRSELPPPPAPKTKPGETFKECAECPEMVVVPAGRFVMGSPMTEAGHGSDEAQHPVTIARPFAVGKFEVTFAQWDACAAAGGCAPPEEGPYKPDDQGWGRDNRPVINVSWQDAKRYVRWLNGRVGGKAYRLLSESEWEYAARGHANGTATDTAYPWGAAASHENANYGLDRCCAGFAAGRDTWVDQTAPVGSFPANAFGLHDMHGNVWEWVEDCYEEEYSGLAPDGSANTTMGCSDRVLRGGSWLNVPLNLRSADRFRLTPSGRFINSGFRVARTL